MYSLGWSLFEPSKSGSVIIITGRGGEGKSCFVSFIEQAFSGTQASFNSKQVQSMSRSRVITLGECQASRVLSEGTYKSLTGNDSSSHWGRPLCRHRRVLIVATNDRLSTVHGESYPDSQARRVSIMPACPLRGRNRRELPHMDDTEKNRVVLACVHRYLFFHCLSRRLGIPEIVPGTYGFPLLRRLFGGASTVLEAGLYEWHDVLNGEIMDRETVPYVIPLIAAMSGLREDTLRLSLSAILNTDMTDSSDDTQCIQDGSYSGYLSVDIGLRIYNPYACNGSDSGRDVF